MKFSSPENQKIIEKFVEKDFSHLKEEHPPLYARATMAQEIAQRLGLLGQDRTECSLDSCQFNTAHRGDGFLQGMQQVASSGRAHQITPENLEILINLIYADAIRFLKEYELTLPPDKQIVSELDNLLRIARKGVQGNITDAERQYDLMQYANTGSIHASLKENIWWALYDMPQKVLKGKIAELHPRTDLAEALSNWNERAAGWSEKLDSMQQDIKERQKEIGRQEKEVEERQKKIEKQKKEIEALPKILKHYRDDFNFVGLSGGFLWLAENLRKQKAFNTLCMFGSVSAVSLWPLLAAAIAFANVIATTPLTWHLWLPIATSLATLELVSVYLFRVVLIRQKSLEAQLLQVHLRMQLCAFVEGYAEFAKKIKKDAPETLSRFEDLVFSGITMDPAQVPSAMDGIEQVAQLIKALKASSKS